MLTEQIKLTAQLRHTTRSKNTLLFLTCLSSIVFAGGAAIMGKASKQISYALVTSAVVTIAAGSATAVKLERRETEIRQKLAQLKKEVSNSRY